MQSAALENLSAESFSIFNCLWLLHGFMLYGCAAQAQYFQSLDLQYCSLYKCFKKPIGAARNVALLISPAISQSQHDPTSRARVSSYHWH
jgi:hypothetical protein